MTSLLHAMLLLGSAAFQGGGAVVPYVDQAPSPAAAPVPPREAIEEQTEAPAGGPLTRNGAVAGRFSAPGQEVVYGFEARRGELSVFELEVAGFTRGWAATAGLRILDESGAALLDVERAGGATFGSLDAFRAPADGTYRLELRAAEQYFRYSIVRHSDFAPPEAEDIAHLGNRELAYGFLDRAADVRRFAVDLEAGERVSVRITPYRESHREALLAERAGVLEELLKKGAAGPPNLDAAMEESRRAGGRGRRATPSDTPLYSLRVLREDVELGSAFLRAEVVAPEAGLYVLEVSGGARGEGGLFELHVDRAPALHSVAVRVGDLDDDPLEGIAVRFLTEPDLSAVAESMTDSSGELRVDLPAGDYSVLAYPGNSGRPERSRVRILGELELNLVYASPIRVPRGRSSGSDSKAPRRSRSRRPSGTRESGRR